jgi:hypothetical protein
LLLDSNKMGELSVSDWELIEEAVQDGLEAGPEKEFLTNAVEHARTGNLRLAIVEGVICLEIVLSQWLKDLLPARGVEASRVKELLGPQIGLSTKLRLLLPLLIDRKELAGSNIDRVTRGVEFRNTIVHKTGHLPTGVDDDTVRESIWAVLSLASRLADKRDRLRLAPSLQKVAQEVATELGVPIPTITAVFRHIYHVGLSFSFLVPFPDDDKLEEVARVIGSKLAAIDARFNPKKHLGVEFAQVGTTVGTWSEGNLRKLAEPLPPLPPSLAADLKKGQTGGDS